MAPDPVNIFEYEEIAKKQLNKGDYDFIAGAATDEITLRRTREVLDSIIMKPRMMVDVSQLDLGTTVLGQKISFPVMLAPAGNHGAAHLEAELATVRAAGKADTLMVLSSHSAKTLEDVAEAATGPIWFQQYFFKDRELTLGMAARAKEAGYSALCLTLDAKIVPKRERNIRNDYVSPVSPNYAHLDLGTHSWKFAADAPAGPSDIRDQATTWTDLEWLAGETKLPIVVKGIMTAAGPLNLALRQSSSPTMGRGTWTPLSRPSRCCPKLWSRLPERLRSTWTVASAGERISSKPWPWAHGPCCWAVPFSGDWPWTAKTASVRCWRYFATN